MKKLLITLLAALMASGAFAQTAFPDIPAGHWAGEAVSRIADLGIVIGFPDGTFRGNESFTRYQAALVVSRLLDVVNAVHALTDADIAALRNALQELAAEVAAQGAVVSTITDDVLANTARIEALEAAVAGAEGEVLQDLQNQLAQLRVAADTALARAANAEALANQALDEVAMLEAQVAQNAAAIGALQDLVSILNEDILALQGVETGDGLSTLAARVGQNESDIANIREFVILLRRDQVALRNRVDALEASDAEQAARLDALDERLTAVEEDLLVVSGSIELVFDVGRLSGDNIPFDVDRAFGANNERSLDDSIFSTGTTDWDDDDDVDEQGDRVQDIQDIESKDGGAFSPTLNLEIAFNQDKDGAGSPNALNNFEAVLVLNLKKAVGLIGTDGKAFDGYVFAVDEFTATFSPIGGPPLTFTFGEDPAATFTPYVFASPGPGFVATVGAPDFLAFLDPTLTVAYGAANKNVDGVSGDDLPDSYYRGARLTVSPFEGVTIGGSFAQIASQAGENADALGDNNQITVFGVDGQVSISIFDVNFEYANSSGQIVTDDGTVLGYGTDEGAPLFYVETTANLDEAGIPIIDTVTVLYRDIPGAWSGASSIYADDGDYPYAEDQAGFLVEASLSLFIVDVDAYFDKFFTGQGDGTGADAAGGGLPITAFGVDAEAELFREIAVTGFFHSVSIAGQTVDKLSTGRINGDNAFEYGDLERDRNYDTGFGVGLAHSGDTEDDDGNPLNPLIPNLNISAEFARINAGFDTTRITAEADYTLGVSILTLTPYVGFESISNPDTDQYSSTEIKVGTGLETEALDIFTQPSFVAAVNYRTKSYTVNNPSATSPEPYDASELQFAVGLQLNEFIFEHSVLTARYASWTGTNISDRYDPPGFADDSATNISAGDENNGLTQATNGYEVVWNYWDLEVAYGVYTSSVENDAGTVSNTAGQAFRISYTVDF